MNPLSKTLYVAFASCLILSSSCKEQSGTSKVDTKDTVTTLTDSSKEATVQSVINQPFENIQVQFQTHKVDPKVGGEFALKSGSKIIVPAGAFVKTDGSPLTEIVMLKYREFRDIDEILVSGIPMTYQHDGQNEHFVSAGMFEIDGELASGEKVSIAKDKSLQVDMTSKTADGISGVNFYSLEKQSIWKQVSSSIRRKIKKEKVVDNSVPVEVKANDLPVSLATKGAYKFELYLDYSKIEDLKDYKDVIWQYEAGKDDPNTYEDFNKEKWTSAAVVKSETSKDLYEITLKSKNKVFVTNAKPVLGEKAYQKALAKAKLENASKRSVVFAQVESMRDMEMVSMQLASIDKFGVYNHDYFMRQNKEPMVASLKLNLPKGQTIEKARVFLVMKKNDAIIEYSTDGYDKLSQFTYDPNENNGLMVVYPKNKVSVINRYDFKNKINSNREIVVDLSKEQNVKDYSSLKSIIEKI